MKEFTRMTMPDDIAIAVPIESDGRVDARLLLIMRNTAWYLYQVWFLDDGAQA